ncbi:MAG: phosphoglycerate kinase [Chloroflexi bacterium]|nr:phosphoglycerate kinase [Chloroflexota bacterium]|tara:strand:+ start:11206 stop:12405 length:1200 start_codon:yes stop_codon:yes gene_type:complete
MLDVEFKNRLIDFDLKNLKVLVRVDFNVPYSMDPTKLLSDLKILSSIPTINYLLDNDCSIIVCSHFGRPKGKYDTDFDLKPIVDRFSDLLGISVKKLEHFDFEHVTQRVKELKSREILMLPNLRFHPGEEENSSEFSSFLASLADLFVNDAFGVAHRSHASTVGVTNYLPSMPGFLMVQEIEVLQKLMSSPQNPFVAVMGGAKVADKIQVIESISKKADYLMIGGGMAATFLKAKGYEVGQSIIDADSLDLLQEFLKTLDAKKCELMLPSDVKVEIPEKDRNVKIVSIKSIPKEGRVMDIGPKTVKNFSMRLRSANTIFWNGPMGVYEDERFNNGTISIAEAISSLNQPISTIVGGGSTADIVEKMQLLEEFSHVSTGGGASLDFLSERQMPALEALKI